MEVRLVAELPGDPEAAWATVTEELALALERDGLRLEPGPGGGLNEADEAVAHIHEDLATSALRMMEVNMEAEVVDAADVRFDGAS